VCVGTLLNVLKDAAGFDGHRTACRIDILDAVHAVERQREHAIGVCTFNEAGFATPRHDGLQCRMAEFEDAGYFRRRRRPQYGSRLTEAAPVAVRRFYRLRPLEQAYGTENCSQFLKKIGHASSNGFRVV